MIALLQRVSEATVTIEGETAGAIGPGLLAFIGVERADTEARADRLLERVLGYRLFSDGRGNMNRSVRDTGGGLLLVPQFTLAADTGKGLRPSFSTAAGAEPGRRLFHYLVEQAQRIHPVVETGRFGERMQVTLCNEGPVTFWLAVPAAPRPPS